MNIEQRSTRTRNKNLPIREACITLSGVALAGLLLTGIPKISDISQQIQDDRAQKLENLETVPENRTFSFTEFQRVACAPDRYGRMPTARILELDGEEMVLNCPARADLQPATALIFSTIE